MPTGVGHAPGGHIGHRLWPHRLWPMWQALTTVSVCFNVNEPELDLSGLGDAIKEFWLNNPAVKAPSRRLKLGFGAVLSASFDPARLPQRPAFIVSGCVSAAGLITVGPMMMVCYL